MVRDRKVWHAAVHEVKESDMTRQLSNNNKHSSSNGFISKQLVSFMKRKTQANKTA